MMDPLAHVNSHLDGEGTFHGGAFCPRFPLPHVCASRVRSVNQGNGWRRLANEIRHWHFRTDMADALTVIRQYNVEKKDVVQRDEQVIFGDFAWPSNTKTNYLIYG